MVSSYAAGSGTARNECRLSKGDTTLDGRLQRNPPLPSQLGVSNLVRRKDLDSLLHGLWGDYPGSREA